MSFKKFLEEAQLDEVTVNYNHLKKTWVTRKDPVNGKFFKPSGNVKNLVLQNATWVIDDEAASNGDRVFAYIKGDRASKLPDGYKARPLGFKADQNAPFFHRDDKSIMKKADYVVFDNKGATAYYKDKINEGSETWEAGYKRRVVKTTKPEHKEKGYKWRIKGKDRPEISIKLYKEKPSQKEFNKQMRRVAGHEFGG